MQDQLLLKKWALNLLYTQALKQHRRISSSTKRCIKMQAAPVRSASLLVIFLTAAKVALLTLADKQAIEQEEVVESAPASLCKEDSSAQDSMRVKFEAAVRRAQDDICKAVSEMDGKQFHEDAWTRPGGGGGVSRVLQASSLANFCSVVADCIRRTGLMHCHCQQRHTAGCNHTVCSDAIAEAMAQIACELSNACFDVRHAGSSKSKQAHYHSAPDSHAVHAIEPVLLNLLIRCDNCQLPFTACWTTQQVLKNGQNCAGWQMLRESWTHCISSSEQRAFCSF